MSAALNNEWAHNAFMVSDGDLADPWDIDKRKWSSAAIKFTDSRLGGNIPINSKYQYTRYSDIRNKGRGSNRATVSLAPTTNNGQGRAYSEVHDDTMQIIYICPGVPQFNSLTTFIRNAVNSDMVTLTRTGRAPSITFKAAEALGTLFVMRMFPIVAVGMFIGAAYRFFTNKPQSKFYTLKPTPHLYWTAVQTIVNAMAVNRGIVPRSLNSKFAPKENMPSQAFVLDQEYLDAYSVLVPDIFRDGNIYDVHALASHTQRTALASIQKEADDFKNSDGDLTGFVTYLKREVTGDGRTSVPGFDKDGDQKFFNMLNTTLSLSSGVNTVKDLFKGEMANETEPRGSIEVDPENPDSFKVADASKTYIESLAEEMDAQFRRGSTFVCFRVNHTGSVSESFSNSVVESSIGQQFNGASSNMANIQFSLAQGNLIGGTIGKVIGGAAEMARDAVKGGLSGVTMGMSNIIDALAGLAYIDIPKHWQSSQVSLPRSTYTLELGGPYNNDLSLMADKYIPLAMILALALPRSTGKASYTSPFICSYYDRGRCQSRLAMVESVSVERGSGTQGFAIDGTPLSMKVTMSFVDLSTIMHMPVGSGSIFSHDSTIDEDGVFSDYLAVLSAMDLHSQYFWLPKAKLKFAKKALDVAKYTSPFWLGSYAHHTMTAGWLNTATLGLSGLATEIIEMPLSNPAITQGSGRGMTSTGQ